MRRTIEYNRPAVMMATSSNRGWEQSDFNLRVELLIQPYALWQRSVRLGAIIQRDFDNLTSIFGFVGGQAWLSDSFVFYAQLYAGDAQADNDCFGLTCNKEGFRLGGDVGTMLYLSRIFAVKLYGGVSSGRSPYVGVGVCWDWLSWIRMGALF
tara:strand:- start:139 stop:597 length:459 start_codon:yes stop_codon:yes gene_type:complete